MFHTSTGLLERGAHMQEETETTETTEELRAERLPKRNDVYKCPKCDNSVTMHIALRDVPICFNPKGNHTSTAVEMVLVDKKAKAKRGK